MICRSLCKLFSSTSINMQAPFHQFFFVTNLFILVFIFFFRAFVMSFNSLNWVMLCGWCLRPTFICCPHLILCHFMYSSPNNLNRTCRIVGMNSIWIPLHISLHSSAVINVELFLATSRWENDIKCRSFQT